MSMNQAQTLSIFIQKTNILSPDLWEITFRFGS